MFRTPAQSRITKCRSLTPDLIEVRNDLLAASMLMGIELPEAEQWREDAKHDVEFRKKWYAEDMSLSQFVDDEEEDEYLGR